MQTVMPVQLSETAVRINGEPSIILCASVFYFRIPRELWKERLNSLRAAGYNCVDVYFPWNNHELSEGVWDFEGERDADAFLQLVKEAGLWTVARPGPYICSEWDGGALPAYLLAKDLKLRDNDPDYLGHVSRWYDRILPIMQRHQVEQDGSILCLQIENELDFYGCDDPQGYIVALRDMALSHGITVPLIACAGQGGLFEASGLVEQVLPTCNFYPNDLDPIFEEKVLHYQRLLADRGLPLLVTETNRSHFLLRRLLSCGAKLLGPYLQVSGTDFGFTNGTNNWGQPLAFMTSDYDFGGMISPEGHIRPEANEGRLLSRLIRSYGASLAEASPESTRTSFSVIGEKPDRLVGPTSLRLSKGGHLVFLHNVGDEILHSVLVQEGVGEMPIVLPAGGSVALPFGIPLADWNFSGTLLHATAELYSLEKYTSVTVAAFHSDTAGEIAFQLDEEVAVWEAEGAEVNAEGRRIRITFDSGQHAVIKAIAPDGRQLIVVVTDRQTALLSIHIGVDGAIQTKLMPTYEKEPVELVLEWSTTSIDPTSPISDSPLVSINHADYLEKFEIYRGYAWYKAKDPMLSSERRVGLLVRQASDVVSIYAGSDYVGTMAPGGLSRYLPSSRDEDDVFTLRTEIWGHTNFDDARLPGLRLNAMKGIQGLVAVTAVKDISQNWRRHRVSEERVPLADPNYDDRLWPVVGFGGYLAMERPFVEGLRKSIATSVISDSWTLHFEGLQVRVQLFVNGKDAGFVYPMDPFVDISTLVIPGEAIHLTVFAERLYEASMAERVVLYEGREATDWKLCSCGGEQGLAEQAKVQRSIAQEVRLPLMLQPGQISWLFAAIPHSSTQGGWRIKVTGSGMKLTVLFQGRIVSRMWLPGGDDRPSMRGGDPNSFWLPGPWWGAKVGELAVLLEAVDLNGDCAIDQLAFIPV